MGLPALLILYFPSSQISRARRAHPGRQRQTFLCVSPPRALQEPSAGTGRCRVVCFNTALGAERVRGPSVVALPSRCLIIGDLQPLVSEVTISACPWVGSVPVLGSESHGSLPSIICQRSRSCRLPPGRIALPRSIRARRSDSLRPVQGLAGKQEGFPKDISRMFSSIMR